MCKFLNVDIPNKPFPRINDQNNVNRIVGNAEDLLWKRLFKMIVVGMFGVVGTTMVCRNNVSK